MDESQPWSEKEVKEVDKIHSALTAELCDDPTVVIPDLGVRTPAQLEDYLARITSRPLAFVVKDIGTDVTGGGRAGKVRKADMARALVDWRLTQPKKSDQPDTTIISADVFETFHSVIRDTITPSWVSSVPHNFGSAAAGTPKADEWRTVFTIHLPLCLISLFGYPSADNPQLDQVLDHTLQLLPSLYPGLDCESIHHMAFHIYDFLELFGPVHSWWAFPFERLIGQLQRLPTNHKFGSYT
ncbi:hypothetical protein GSI_10454 [Ganoderma sinense ZZ0214-1]|uniref:Uncharacterized protein n=1 Tax=Ganoderma sinense ZZ0214-1 TaxID=1077348 RepID=A0A2G8S0N9_9APHY|nr:hypothetical protein GSI_10454 [Ganoderma sinense ZZ0214-1]